MRIIVTGGAGFIGSALVRHLVAAGHDVLTVDALTYAGNRASLRDVEGNSRHRFLHANICDRAGMDGAMAEFRPERITHLAAESHVDRSITGAADFVQTNVVGTFTLLEAARGYWQGLAPAAKAAFRFSTFRLTRFMARWAMTGCSMRPRLTIPRRPIRRRRRRRTISPRPGTARMACRWWYRTARTITDLTTSPKS